MTEEAARARARAFALIADLWAKGLQPDTLEAWRLVPELPVSLPEHFDADEAGASHVAVTLTELFPYASVFLDASALLGGDEAAAVRDTRAAAGFGAPTELEPDHIAELLRLLAFLSAAEADALRDGVAAPHIGQHQAAVLDRHLLRFLPALVVATDGLGLTGADALYAHSLRLALDLCVAWRPTLPGAAAAWTLPELRPGLLADQKTGLGRIARRLCAPALAGAFLSQAALRRIGRAHQLPAGFGKRWQVLENLLSAGAHYEAVPVLLAALDEELARSAVLYDVVADSLPQAVAPWQQRVAEGRALVAEMGASLS